jgi:hypothetical protein
VALGALLVLALRGRRARKAWEARLDGAVAESRWLAHELVPGVLSIGSPAGRRGAWTASRPRVEALETELRPVVASAPKDRVGSLDRLQTAVIDTRSAMDAYAVTAFPDDRESLGAARQAQRQLEQALGAFQPPPAS